MSVLDLIKERRTVRNFKADPIDENIVDEILESGVWAPSHVNSQPWEFKVIGPETRGKLLLPFQDILEKGPLARPNMPEEAKAKVRKFGENFGDAPLMIAAISKAPENPLQVSENPQSVAAALQNMSLVGWEKGIGSVWLSMDMNPQVRDILEVGEEEHIIGVLAMGYFEQIPPAPERDSHKERTTYLP